MLNAVPVCRGGGGGGVQQKVIRMLNAVPVFYGLLSQ